MKFYEIDSALLEAIGAGDKRVRVKFEIDVDGGTTSVSDNDVLEADFFALKEAAGGTASRAGGGCCWLIIRCGFIFLLGTV